jgi:hypothetical protein
VPGSFAGVPGSFAGVPRSFVGVPRSFAGVPRSFAGLPRSFAGLPRSFVGVPRSFVGVPRSFAGLPRSFAGVPRSFVGVPRSFAGCPFQASGLALPRMVAVFLRKGVFYEWARNSVDAHAARPDDGVGDLFTCPSGKRKMPGFRADAVRFADTHAWAGTVKKLYESAQSSPRSSVPVRTRRVTARTGRNTASPASRARRSAR